MGKINKRNPVKHSNHHDNPRKAKKTIIRRQHSQNVSRDVNPQVKSKPGQVDENPGASRHPVKLKVPFTKGDRILLVGEGDFSFTLSLCQNFDICKVVATCFDSKDKLVQKHPNVSNTLRVLSPENLDAEDVKSGTRPERNSADSTEEEWNGFSSASQSETDSTDIQSNDELKLRSKPVTLLYGIDATKLSSVHKKVLKTQSPFTKIVFNFPHVGGLSTDVNRQVRSNQQLLVNFFNSAKPLLATKSMPAAPQSFDEDNELEEYSSDIENQDNEYLKHGQILVTIFEGEPYTLWNVRDLARHCGLKVLESFKFPWSAYPGYQHARTIGDITSGKDRSEEGKRKGAWRGEERDARCYVLAPKDDNDGRPAPGSKKRKHDEDDRD